MRKLAMALLLSAALPALASVQSDIDGGMSATDAFTAANASCDTAACTDQVLADLLAAGVTVKDALAIAINSGIPSDAAAKSLIAAGANPQDVTAATSAGPVTTTNSVVVKSTIQANISAN